MEIQGVIFDLDGTLLDSTWIWSKIDEDFLGKYGFDVPADYSQAVSSMGFENVAVYTIKRFGLKLTKEEVMAEWDAMAYEAYAHEIQLKPGTLELLQWLKREKIPAGIATSNSASLFEPCLQNNKVYELFHSFTETGDVERGKEFPDVYIKAAEKLGADPKKCIVFEDIIPALNGARKGGFITVGVREEKWQYEDEMFRASCDYVIEEIHDAISLLNQIK